MGKRLITLRLDEKLYKEIEEWKKLWDKTRTKMIEELIREGLKIKKRKAIARISLIYFFAGLIALLIYFF